MQRNIKSVKYGYGIDWIRYSQNLRMVSITITGASSQAINGCLLLFRFTIEVINASAGSGEIDLQASEGICELPWGQILTFQKHIGTFTGKGSKIFLSIARSYENKKKQYSAD